jgi:hypothetical protein
MLPTTPAQIARIFSWTGEVDVNSAAGSSDAQVQPFRLSLGGISI